MAPGASLVMNPDSFLSSSGDRSSVIGFPFSPGVVVGPVGIGVRGLRPPLPSARWTGLLGTGPEGISHYCTRSLAGY